MRFLLALLVVFASVPAFAMPNVDLQKQGVYGLREAYAGGKLSLQIASSDFARSVGYSIVTMESGSTLTSGRIHLGAGESGIEVPVPASLSTGFYTVQLSEPAKSWTFYVYPAVELVYFDADRICAKPGETVNLIVRVDNHTKDRQVRNLKIVGGGGVVFGRQLVLAPGERLIKTCRTKKTGRFTAQAGSDSLSVMVQAGSRRAALARKFRIYMNMGGDSEEHVREMFSWFAKTGYAGICLPRARSNPFIDGISKQYGLPITGESLIEGGDIERFNIGADDPDGERMHRDFHSEDKTLRGSLVCWERVYKDSFAIPNLREIKMVEPVDTWWHPKYEVMGYSADAVTKYRRCLNGTDEGLRIVENKRFVKRIHFADFYKFYEKRPLDKSDFGLASWDEYDPIAIPKNISDADRSAHAREIQLVYLLRRYINTQYLDKLSQYISAHNVACGIIPSFYGNTSARDRYFSYALPYIDTYYEEPFDTGFRVLRRIEWEGDDLKALATRFDKRLSLVIENGQPRCVPYWGTKVTYAMIYGWFSTFGAHDLQIDFWERIDGEKSAAEVFDQSRDLIEAAVYYQKHPAASLCGERKIGIPNTQISFDRQEWRGGVDFDPWSEKLSDAFYRGYRYNVFDACLTDSAVQSLYMKGRNGYAPISGDPAAYEQREISTSAGSDCMASVYRSLTNKADLHIILIDKRENGICYAHYHKSPSAFTTYQTMDELEAMLPDSAPITVTLYVPLPAGKYKVESIFVEGVLAEFSSDGVTPSTFTLPGIKAAEIYHVSRQ